MAVIGFRFSNNDYAFCILLGDRNAPVVEEAKRIVFPKGFSEPELLKWLFQEMGALFQRHNFSAVGIKKAEGTVKRSNALETRIQADALASLAAAQAGCLAVHRKMNSTIAKDLGLKGKGRYLQTKLDTSPIPDFDSYTGKLQEAILVAWSCL